MGRDRRKRRKVRITQSQSREMGQTRRKRDISIPTKMLQKGPNKICMQES